MRVFHFSFDLLHQIKVVKGLKNRRFILEQKRQIKLAITCFMDDPFFFVVFSVSAWTTAGAGRWRTPPTSAIFVKGRIRPEFEEAAAVTKKNEEGPLSLRSSSASFSSPLRKKGLWKLMRESSLRKSYETSTTFPGRRTRPNTLEQGQAGKRRTYTGRRIH